MTMNRSIRTPLAAALAAVGLVTAGLVIASPAHAGCSYYEQPSPAAAAAASDGVRFMTIANVTESGPSIVGLWRFKMIAKGNAGIPDGVEIDFGTTQWHADGTEIMISGSRPPMSGDVCMGAWRQTSRNSVVLNHLALAWDPTGTVFVGPAKIVEQLTVNTAGTGYAGTFTLDQYAIDEQTVLAHVTGTVTATRLTAN